MLTCIHHFLQHCRIKFSYFIPKISSYRYRDKNPEVVQPYSWRQWTNFSCLPTDQLRKGNETNGKEKQKWACDSHE